MSLQEKDLQKRRINKEHNSNFRAGYVTINEEQLHKTGLRGRKIYIFFFVVACIVLLALANLAITITIFVKLQIGREGLHAMEFMPGGKLLRFFVDTYIDDAYIYNSAIGGLKDEELEISSTSSESPVVLKLRKRDAPFVSISESGHMFENIDNFEVINPETGDHIFSASNPRIPDDMDELFVESLVASSVSSLAESNLTLSSKDGTTVVGNEGVTVRADEQVLLPAKDSLLFEGRHIELRGEKGIMIEKLPLENTHSGGGEAFKLCVMMPRGQLFMVPVTASCTIMNSGK